MIALSVLLIVLAVVVSAPAWLLLVQVCAARAARPEAQRSGQGALPRSSGAGQTLQCVATVRSRMTVLIPAHNEEAGLPATLASVLTQLHADDRILVVADNCDDATAAVAGRADARVLVTERFDTTRRGKGYALDCGVRRIETWPEAPDIVVIVDADCTLEPGALDALARSVEQSGRPAQALYVMRAPAAKTLGQRIAEFAWILKNHVRAAGMDAMNLPCQLMGSGMAFPWPVLREAPLATGHLVEDMKLGADLAALGRAPRFCESAVVRSDFPSHEDGLKSQRVRWEQGHLSVIATQGLPALVDALRHGRVAQAALAADLCVPPLSSLVMAQLIVLVLASGGAVLGGQGWALGIVLCGCLMLTLAVVLAWDSHAREVISAKQFSAIPSYVGAKLPLYWSTLAGKRSEWIRTRRDRE